ncbi:hypothetical protein [Burkholderia ubonensis]|nr:hypothetical protein [Burkholderia ubonensis]
MSLEDVVRKIVRAGGSVVITGNAGDGTHGGRHHALADARATRFAMMS